jgi:hypothetical protein
MSGEQRLLLAFEMSLFVRELAKWPEARVARQLLRLAFFSSALPSAIP